MRLNRTNIGVGLVKEIHVLGNKVITKVYMFTINIKKSILLALKRLTQGPNKIDFVVFLLLYRHASVYSTFPFKSICNFVGYHNYNYGSW